MWHSDAYRRAYLLAVAGRMAGGDHDRIAARARALLAKWRAQDGVLPLYIERWEAAISEGPQAVERIAVEMSAESEALRHCMPFAGILSNRERSELRRQHAS